MKNSENTQRSVIESENRILTNEYSPTSQLGSSNSFFKRIAESVPKRKAFFDSEKDKLGREKLNKFHNRKHTDYQLSLLKNRIKKLAKEETMAQKKIQETQRRADTFLETRYKYDVDQSIKHQHRYKVQKETEAKREQLRQERINSYERKKQIRMNMLENKLRDGLIVKQTLQNGFQDRDYRLNNDLKHKLEKIRKVKDGHKRSSMSKVERQSNIELSNQKRVEHVMNKDQSKAAANINKMKKLEEKEIEIMERLKQTLNMQQQAVLNFENMVMAKDRSLNGSIGH